MYSCSRGSAEKKIATAVSLIAIVLLQGFAFSPISSADSTTGNNGTWSISTNGTIVASGISNSTFTGLCTLDGNSSGTSGGCQINILFILSYSSFRCTLNVNITGWIIGGPAKSPEFVITSGKSTAISPSTADSQFCITVSFPAGTVDPTTGVFIAPVYTLIPAVPGEYYLDGYGELPANSYTDVSFTPYQPTNSNFSSIIVSNSTLNSVLENPPVSIDQELFMSTVPNYVSIGQNYTVKVLVRNNSDQPIPIYFRVEPPINAMTVHPIFVEALVPPNGQVTGNFTVIPFNSSYQGTINVTAVLYIWYYHQMGRPDQVQQLSALVYGVHPYRYSQVVLILLALVMIIPASALYLNYSKFRRK